MLIAACACSVVSRAAGAVDKLSSFDTHAAGFAIAFSGEVSAYRDLSTYVLPGAALAIEAVNGPPGDYSATASAGALTTRGPRAWQWRAPSAPGLFEVRVEGPAIRHDIIALHVFVIVPADDVRNGSLNGYAIGQYPAKLLNGNR